MGLSGIAKAPVSHGVEPHDLETGGLALASALAFRLYRSSLSPPLPRERFSAWVEGGRTLSDPRSSQKGGMYALTAWPEQAGKQTFKPEQGVAESARSRHR